MEFDSIELYQKDSTIIWLIKTNLYYSFVLPKPIPTTKIATPIKAQATKL